MLEGLRSGSADADQDGSVTVAELQEYVSRRVRELTDGGQTPTARRIGVAFDFAVF